MTASRGGHAEAASLDLATLLGVTALAFVLANVVHEGAGHGGACVIAGGRAVTWNAIYFECDSAGMSAAGTRWLAAAGTLANLALSALAFLALALTPPRASIGRYFLWMVGTLDLMQATGYWLFSGVAGVGDWVSVVRGLEPTWAWRLLLTAAGIGGYSAAIWIGLRTLSTFLGDGDDRLALARRLTLVPYLAGGALYVAAGVLNPQSLWLVLVSAAAASFGGASGLAWMYHLLDDRRRFPPSELLPLRMERSGGWIAAGAAVALLFVLALGRGISFRG